jgi:hypothetical protein
MRGVLLVITTILLAVTGAPAQLVIQEPEQTRTIVAVIVQVDSLARTATVLDTWGKATQFDLHGAEIRMSRNAMEEFATLYDLEPGLPVQVTYGGDPGDPDIIRVIILTDQVTGSARYRICPYRYYPF